MISFREVTVDDAEMILGWRILNRVTKFMVTDVENNVDIQKEWILTSYNDERYYHWVVEYNNIAIGLVNISDLSLDNGMTSWGFYIGKEDMEGIGAFIPPYFYNFAFDVLSVDYIDVEVFYNNTSVIGLHLLHGYRFVPSHDRVVVKNKKDILLVSMKLARDDWNFARYSKNRAEFPMEKWNARPSFLL